MNFLKIIVGSLVFWVLFICLYDSIVNQSIKPMFMVLLLLPSVLSFRYVFKVVKKNNNKAYSANRTSKVTPAIKHSINEINLEKHKAEIEDYNKFLSQVYLCTSNICIHKETKELFEFNAKIVGNKGGFEQYCFKKKPQKINSFSRLISCLHYDDKVFFNDLNENNWQEYFSFMILPPEHNGKTLKKQLLSRDTQIVRNAVFAVHRLVLKSPQARKKILDDSYQSLSLIKQNLEGLDMKGLFASNNRFANRAIQIIEGNNTDKCFCRLLIDEFGPSANGLAKNGFILVQPDESVNEYSRRGIIECPVCHKRYSITEEYTGWHIPTRIHCNEIQSKVDAANHGDSDVKHCLSNEHHFVELKHFTGGSECHCSKCGLVIKFNRGCPERIEAKEMAEFLSTYQGSTIDF